MSHPINNLDVHDLDVDTGPTPQQVDAFAEKYAEKIADRLPPSSLHVPPQRPRKHRILSPSEVTPLVSRPGWHARSTPEEVAEAWEAVQAAEEALEVSTAAVKALQADQQQEGAGYAAAV